MFFVSNPMFFLPVSSQCSKDVNWKTSKVIFTEKGFKQRKIREGVESEKLKFKGKTPLISYEQRDTQHYSL